MEKENVENWDVFWVNNEENDWVNELNKLYNVCGEDVIKFSRKVFVSRKCENDKVDRKILKDDSGIILEEEVKYGIVIDKIVEDVYDMGKKIGDGNFVDVCVCSDKIIKKEFVLKIVDKVKIRGKE